MSDDVQVAADPTEKLRLFAVGLAEMIADEPDDVDVDAELEGNEVLLTMTAAPDDIGLLIGKQGRTARSLRTILSAAGSKMGRRVSLDVVDDLDDEADDAA